MTGLNTSGVAPAIVAPPAALALYGAVAGSSTTSDLYLIDTATAAGTSIGPIGFAVTGMAFRPSDNVLFGVASNNSAANPRSLITIDTTTGDGTLVGALGITSGLADIAFSDTDVLYGYRPANNTLYTVNTTTGAATQVSATAIPSGGFGFGLDFDSNGVLYVFPRETNGVFYIVNPATGGLTVQPTLSGTPVIKHPVSAAAFDADDLVWATMLATDPDVYLLTIDVGTATTAEVALTVDLLDALAWGPA